MSESKSEIVKCEDCGKELYYKHNNICRECYEKMIKKSLDWSKRQ